MADSNIKKRERLVMRKMMLCAALLPLAGVAGEAVLGTGGTLRLESPAFELNGCLFTAGWKKSVSGGGTGAPDEKGACVFTIKASDKETVAGQVAVSSAADGAVHAVYTLTPKADMVLNGLYVGSHFSAQKLAGGHWKPTAKRASFPKSAGPCLSLAAR